MQLDFILKDFETRPVQHLPLKLCHDFGYAKDATFEEKQAVVRRKLIELKRKGFGGIVTNVAFGSHYLRDPEEWRLLHSTFEACRELGLRTWIYDEDGYPSGSAGGLTLRGHPEWQAQGLAMKAVTFAAGETIDLPFPHGHTDVFAAFAYRCTDIESITDSEALQPWKSYPFRGQEGIHDVNTTSGPVTAVLFLRKNMYEGTHAVHNVSTSRRYIDVSNKEAVATFIENTYKPYLRQLSDIGPIEAIFTDEPSFMGAYINLELYPDSVTDSYDDTIELLPCVNWGANVANRFGSMHGYALKDRVVLLFGGHGELARTTRRAFYETLSRLYEEAFFAQLSDVCESFGVPFSGHVLLEDDLRYHPVFEGNFFSLLRHMHYPGIDMLHGIPERIRQDAFTPKLVSSVAHTYGRKHVMSEISAHAQGGKVTPEQFRGSMYIQYALGVDIFTSYFSENQVDDAYYLAANKAIGRIDRIMGGGRHISGIAVYYPIETVQADTIPHGKEIYAELDMNPENTACWKSLKSVIDTFMTHQTDFDFLDAEALEKCTLSKNSFTAPGGERFFALILPENCEVPPVIDRLRNANIPVIIGGTPEAILKAAQGAFEPLVEFENAPELQLLCRENENGRTILLVNTAERALQTRGVVRTLGDTVCIFDPAAAEIRSLCPADAVEIAFAPYEALMLLPNP